METKKSYSEKLLAKVQDEISKGIPARTVLRHFRLGLIPVSNGTDFRRLNALARSLNFLNFVGQLYLKEPELVTQKKVKEYFDLLRTVDSSVTKLAELYYSEEFVELRNKIFERAGMDTSADTTPAEDKKTEYEVVETEEENEKEVK